MTGHGWTAHLEQEWMRDGYRLHLYRAVGAGRVEVAHAELCVTTVDPGVRPVESGLFLPCDAWEAIVNVVDPPAHKAELRRLEEALAVERARVDLLLGRVVA